MRNTKEKKKKKENTPIAYLRGSEVCVKKKLGATIMRENNSTVGISRGNFDAVNNE